jgi:hypothetical protein
MLTGCIYFVSWDDVSRPWIGDRISEYMAIHGGPTSVSKLPNGNFEFEFNFIRVDPSCKHYWIVGEDMVMKSYRYEGRCGVM